jgi:murein endopeptidase
MRAIPETNAPFKTSHPPLLCERVMRGLVFFFLATVTSWGLAGHASAQQPDETEAVNTPGAPSTSTEPAKLPYIAVPPRRDIPFTELLDEERRLVGSLSEGRTSGGALLNAAQLAIDGLYHHVLDAHLERDTHWGTEELVSLLQATGRHAATRYAGMRIGIGNMSRRPGGRLVWSRSHHCGRDADLAFRYLDESGEPVESPDLLYVNRRLNVTGRDGWTLDVPRTWAIVAGLIESAPDMIQWIFVYRPIGDALLEHARAIDADPATLEIAERVLHQPGDSAPHNDHLHLRIYCSAEDLLEGCENFGPTWAHMPDYEPLVYARMWTVWDALYEGTPDEQQSALDLLETRDFGAAAPALAWDLGGINPDVALEVLAWLGRHDEDAAIRGATGILRSSDDERIVIAALRELQATGDQRILFAVREVLSGILNEPATPSPRLVQAVADALSIVPSATDAPALWRVNLRLVESVDSLEPEVLESTQSALARAMGRALYSQHALDFSEETVERRSRALDENPNTDFCQRSLAEAGYDYDDDDTESWGALLSALEDERDWVAWHAERELCRLTRRGPTPDSWDLRRRQRHWRNTIS